MQSYFMCIFNTETKIFSPPLLFNSPEQGVETFKSEMNLENSELLPLAHKLELYVIGRYDVKSAKIKPYLFKKLAWKFTPSSSLETKEN